MPVADSLLQEPAAPGRQVMNQPRRSQGQPLEVDDVQVGLLPDGELAPVGQAEQVRRVSGLLAYDLF